jgi:hypothetical protein
MDSVSFVITRSSSQFVGEHLGDVDPDHANHEGPSASQAHHPKDASAQGGLGNHALAGTEHNHPDDGRESRNDQADVLHHVEKQRSGEISNTRVRHMTAKRPVGIVNGAGECRSGAETDVGDDPGDHEREKRQEGPGSRDLKAAQRQLIGLLGEVNRPEQERGENQDQEHQQAVQSEPQGVGSEEERSDLDAGHISYYHE